VELSGNYIDVPLADPRQPSLPFWEVREMRKLRRFAAKARHDPALAFAAVKKNAELVDTAKRTTEQVRREERLRQAQAQTAASTEIAPPAPKCASKTDHLDYDAPVAIAPLDDEDKTS